MNELFKFSMGILFAVGLIMALKGGYKYGCGEYTALQATLHTIPIMIWVSIIHREIIK